MWLEFSTKWETKWNSALTGWSSSLRCSALQKVTSMQRHTSVPALCAHPSTCPHRRLWMLCCDIYWQSPRGTAPILPGITHVVQDIKFLVDVLSLYLIDLEALSAFSQIVFQLSADIWACRSWSHAVQTGSLPHILCTRSNLWVYPERK